MQSGKSFRGNLAVLVLPALLITACGEKPQTSAPEPEKTEERPSTAQHIRAARAAMSSKADQPEEPAVAMTNAPVASAQVQTQKSISVEAFSERLRAIVGDAYVSGNELKERAERGDAAAQHELGGNAWNAGEFDEALKWYKLAADQGHAKAQHSLGVLYVFGQGVEKNIEEAIRWFAKAAEGGNPQAQYSLGVRYVNGEGVEKNFGEAAKWFGKAAENGVSDAQVSLARRFAAGEGVEQDLVEAYKWAEIAFKSGTYQKSAASQLREQYSATMTPEQIAQAKALADAFVPKQQQ